MKALLIFLLFPNILFSQLSNAHKTCLKNFYKLLYQDKVTIGEMKSVFSIENFEDSLFILARQGNLKEDKSYLNLPRGKMERPPNSLSYLMMEYKNFKEVLTQGLPLDRIYKIIDNAIAHRESDEFSDYLELTFPNKQKVFFCLSRETPSFIVWIWLNNGDSLNDIIYADIPVSKMKWLGIIKDTDGYVNVREDLGTKSKVVKRIYKNEVFYYTPVGGTDWWPISIVERGAYIGYIYRDRIVTYPNFPKDLKDKINKDY